MQSAVQAVLATLLAHVPPDLYAQHALLDALISALCLQLVRVQARIAANAPVSRIPDDILAHIFTYASRNTNPYSATSATAAAIAGTCRRWRTLAIAQPAIWTRVDLRHASAPFALKYSRRLGLHVRLDAPLWKERDTSLARTLSPHIQRLRQLWIQTAATHTESFLQAIAGPTQLERLVITGRYTDDHPVALPAALLPRLRHLALTHAHLAPTPVPSNLLTLSLKPPPGAPPLALAALTSLLRASPGLTELALYGGAVPIYKPGEPQPPTDARADLPRLRTLRVAGVNPVQAAWLLFHLSYPASTHLTLEMEASRPLRTVDFDKPRPPGELESYLAVLTMFRGGGMPLDAIIVNPAVSTGEHKPPSPVEKSPPVTTEKLAASYTTASSTLTLQAGSRATEVLSRLISTPVAGVNKLVLGGLKLRLEQIESLTPSSPINPPNEESALAHIRTLEIRACSLPYPQKGEFAAPRQKTETIPPTPGQAGFAIPPTPGQTGFSIPPTPGPTGFSMPPTPAARAWSVPATPVIPSTPAQNSLPSTPKLGPTPGTKPHVNGTTQVNGPKPPTTTIINTSNPYTSTGVPHGPYTSTGLPHTNTNGTPYVPPTLPLWTPYTSTSILTPFITGVPLSTPFTGPINISLAHVQGDKSSPTAETPTSEGTNATAIPPSVNPNPNPAPELDLDLGYGHGSSADTTLASAGTGSDSGSDESKEVPIEEGDQDETDSNEADGGSEFGAFSVADTEDANLTTITERTEVELGETEDEGDEDGRGRSRLRDRPGTPGPSRTGTAAPSRTRDGGSTAGTVGGSTSSVNGTSGTSTPLGWSAAGTPNVQAKPLPPGAPNVQAKPLPGASNPQVNGLRAGLHSASMSNLRAGLGLGFGTGVQVGHSASATNLREAFNARSQSVPNQAAPNQTTPNQAASAQTPSTIAKPKRASTAPYGFASYATGPAPTGFGTTNGTSAGTRPAFAPHSSQPAVPTATPQPVLQHSSSLPAFQTLRTAQPQPAPHDQDPDIRLLSALSFHMPALEEVRIVRSTIRGNALVKFIEARNNLDDQGHDYYDGESSDSDEGVGLGGGAVRAGLGTPVLVLDLVECPYVSAEHVRALRESVDDVRWKPCTSLGGF